MSNYAIYPGFDADVGDLVPFAPQPKMPRGIEYPEIVYGGDLSAAQIGTATFDLVWSNTITRYAMNNILIQAGLNAKFGSEIDSVEVTVRIRDNDGDSTTLMDDWIIVNAVAQRPREYRRFYIGWANHVITFQVIELATP
jgi:hypothetical protein